MKSNRLRRAPGEFPVLNGYSWCCGCETKCEPGSVVLAHLPNPGDAGMGMKCPDWWAAWLCPDCHREADHGAYRRDYLWRSNAIKRTLELLFREGTLAVRSRSDAL